LSRQVFLDNFGSYFDEFEFPGCKIIHPNNAAKVKDKFNSIKGEQTLKDLAEQLPMEHCTMQNLPKQTWATFIFFARHFV